MKKLSSLILVIFAGKFAFSQTKSAAEKWNTLAQANYTIQYPGNWEVDKSGQLSTSFMMFSPLESAQDKFRENVNLLIQDLTGKNIDLNKFTQISEEQIKTLMKNSKIIESKRLKNGTQEFHKIIYKGQQQNYDLEFEQYYWVIKNSAYILTFTAEQGRFENYKATREKIMSSFKLK